MSLRNEAEHIPDLALIPLGGMNVRCDGVEQSVVALQISTEQEPVPTLRQCEQVT